jgi:hypothetical protein
MALLMVPESEVKFFRSAVLKKYHSFRNAFDMLKVGGPDAILQDGGGGGLANKSVNSRYSSFLKGGIREDGVEIGYGITKPPGKGEEELISPETLVG